MERAVLDFPLAAYDLPVVPEFVAIEVVAEDKLPAGLLGPAVVDALAFRS